MAKKHFEVLRQHEGDKTYFEGDVREATAGEVKHLVDLGVLRALDDEDADAIRERQTIALFRDPKEGKALVERFNTAFAGASDAAKRAEAALAEVTKRAEEAEGRADKAEGSLKSLRAEHDKLKADPRLKNKMEPAPENKGGSGDDTK